MSTETYLSREIPLLRMLSCLPLSTWLLETLAQSYYSLLLAQSPRMPATLSNLKDHTLDSARWSVFQISMKASFMMILQFAPQIVCVTGLEHTCVRRKPVIVHVEKLILDLIAVNVPKDILGILRQVSVTRSQNAQIKRVEL